MEQPPVPQMPPFDYPESQPPAGFIVRKRYGRAGTVITIALIAGLMIGGGAIAVAFLCGETWWERTALVLLGALMLSLPVWTGFTLMRRKLRTGHWLMNDEERRAAYARLAQRDHSRMMAWTRWTTRCLSITVLLLAFLVPLLRHQRVGFISYWTGAVMLLNLVPDIIRYRRKRQSAAVSS
jgi:hypothetical protein